MIIETQNQKYEIVIGIEIHAQLNIKAKLFSCSRADSGNDINENVSLFDIATPGQLPILNMKAVEEAAKIGVALNAEVNLKSMFDRKHYFYPDLPQGYQITQFYEPIIKNGKLEIELEDGSIKIIRIARAHLEQDAGKLVHDLIPNKTVVDLNRSGIALLEIVSEADIQSPHEACEYIKNLRSTLRAINACNADMEKGEMRCDVNISIMPVGSSAFGTRCEIKNVNSVKFVAKAIEYEANRQVKEIEAGREIICETRLFDSNLGVTKSMRSKESATDYRYIPDPDIKPVIITKEFVQEIEKNLPELPFAKKTRYQAEFGLSSHEAGLLTAEKEISSYFEALLPLVNNSKLCSTWITGELFAKFNATNQTLKTCKINTQNFAELLNAIQQNEISGKQAKDVFTEMFETGKDAKEIIKEKGFVQISNTEEIAKIINTVLEKNASKVEEYKSGKVKLFGYFTGEVMKLSKGMVNPALASELLKKQLDE